MTYLTIFFFMEILKNCQVCHGFHFKKKRLLHNTIQIFLIYTATWKNFPHLLWLRWRTCELSAHMQVSHPANCKHMRWSWASEREKSDWILWFFKELFRFTLKMLLADWIQNEILLYDIVVNGERSSTCILKQNWKLEVTLQRLYQFFNIKLCSKFNFCVTIFPINKK